MDKRWSRTIGDSGIESRRWLGLRLVTALAALASILLRIGWREPIVPEGALTAVEWLALLVYAGSLIVERRLAHRPIVELPRARPVEVALLTLAVLLAWLPPAVTVIVAVLALYQLLTLYLGLVARSPSPSWVFAGTFASLIIAGTLALKLPVATPPEAPIHVVDALFTATSAVCVTGLTVRDTGTEFTRAGQTIILVLIQLGGLGIVIFGALLALAMGSSMGLRVSRTIADSTAEGHARPTTVRTLVAFIAAATIALELIGAIVLFFGWPRVWEGAPDLTTLPSRAFHALFFSVSAFCNAGFATTAGSLEGLRFHWTSQIVIAGLIVIGGLGFPALGNLRAVGVARLRGRRLQSGALVRLNLHTKLVLLTTLALYLAGASAIFLGRMTQGGESVFGAALDGHFMSITARTAGFDTITPGSMGPLGRLALITFMFIGGSPGSTAGGVKTIAFAIIALTIWATIRGKPTTEAFGRTIPESLVRRAATLITLGAGTIATLTLVLALTDGQGRLLGDLLFEVVSASSTVGLTTGITPGLSDAGRLVLVVAMFLGRVGPLVILVALAAVGRRAGPARAYPSETVVMS